MIISFFSSQITITTHVVDISFSQHILEKAQANWIVSTVKTMIQELETII